MNAASGSLSGSEVLFLRQVTRGRTVQAGSCLDLPGPTYGRGLGGFLRDRDPAKGFSLKPVTPLRWEQKSWVRLSSWVLLLSRQLL